MKTTRILPRWVAASALALGLVAGGYGIATAASGGGTTTTTGTTTGTTGSTGTIGKTAPPARPDRGEETPLTGDALAKATAAALARVPGGKVVRAENDADGTSVYEVHMTNASGAPVTVHLDKDFAVVSVDTDTHGGGRGGPHGGPGRHGGGGPRGGGSAPTGHPLADAAAAALSPEPRG